MVNAVISKVFGMLCLCNMFFLQFLPCLCFPLCTFFLIRALRTAKNKQNEPNTDERSVIDIPPITLLFKVYVQVRSDNKTSYPRDHRLLFSWSTPRNHHHDPSFLQQKQRSYVRMHEEYQPCSLLSRTASVDTVSVFTCLLTINSTSHFFLCVFLCRQYKRTVRRLLRWDKFEKMVGRSKSRVSKEARHGRSFMVRLSWSSSAGSECTHRIAGTNLATRSCFYSSNRFLCCW